MRVLRFRARRGLVLVGLLGLMTVSSAAQGRTLGDVMYSHPAGTDHLGPAYFPHWVHRLKYKCYACHDGLFPMRRGATPTMAAMTRGESCGACHNGKVAFGTDTCHRCHMQP